MNQTNSQKLIGLHLDLKGMQFQPEYGDQFLDDAASLGINSLLVEYEDVFPFSDIDIATDKASVWPRAQLDKFLARAKELEIEVVPLQQCLGHLEYLLMRGYDEFSLPAGQPDTLDISNQKAKDLVRSMLKEIIEAHKDSRYIMLGMDEAFPLIDLARRNNLDGLQLFLDYLDELCTLCESYNKVPLIWDDMLVDHLSEGSLPLLQHFKDRVILVSWDYVSRGEETNSVRMGGWRVSREWLDDPGHRDAPTIQTQTEWIEDLPPFAQNLIEPFRRGRGVVPMFQADLWTSLGFKVIGASTVRMTSDGAVMPEFHKHRENVAAWSRACERNDLVGQIATSWARGRTTSPPNLPFDLTWPLVQEMARSMGAQPKDFFEGIEPKTVQRIVQTLGRCREDWRIEKTIAEEMDALAPQLRTHQFEWKSLSLLAHLLALHHNCDFTLMITEHRESLSPGWVVRFEKLLAELDATEAEVAAHFSHRYRGAAYEEWLKLLFKLHRKRLQAALTN